MEYEEAPFYDPDQHDALPRALRALWGTLTYAIAEKFYTSSTGERPADDAALGAFLNAAVPEYYSEGNDEWIEDMYDYS